MQSLSYSLLRPAVEDSLGMARYSPRKLVLLHTAVGMSVGLVLSIITYLLDLGIAQTGGLSGIGNRTVLETIQTMLSMVSMVLLPFWEIGYLCAALQFARRQSADPTSLYHGLRHWGVVLRSMLLKGGILALFLFVGSQIITTIYMFTPAGGPLLDLSMELQFMPFFLLGVMLLSIPVLYLLRFTDYVVMDQPEMGALYAILVSFHMTRRHCRELIKLDLRFWWYYVLELMVVVISYGHLILDVMGIDIGIGGDTAMFVFYIVSLAGQLGLYVWKKNTVFTTYALAYDIMHQTLMPAAKQEN